MSFALGPSIFEESDSGNKCIKVASRVNQGSVFVNAPNISLSFTVKEKAGKTKPALRPITLAPAADFKKLRRDSFSFTPFSLNQRGVRYVLSKNDFK